MNKTILAIFIFIFFLSGLYGDETGLLTQTSVSRVNETVSQPDGTNPALTGENEESTPVNEVTLSDDTSDAMLPPSNISGIHEKDMEQVSMNEAIQPADTQILAPRINSVSPSLPVQLTPPASFGGENTAAATPTNRSVVSQKQQCGISSSDEKNTEITENSYLYWGLGLLVVFGVAILISLFVKKSPVASEPIKDTSVFQVAQMAANEANKTNPVFLPFHIFPSDWFRKIDPKKMDEFVTKTRNDAVEKFFSALDDKGIPTAIKLENAQRDMGQLLNERMISIGILEMINGDEVIAPKDRNYLTQTLNVLLPAIKIPQPLVLKGEVNIYVLGFLAAIGAFFGFSLGGSFGRWGIGVPAEAGMMFGSVVGAGAIILLAMYIADHPKIRRAILLTIGGGAMIDTLLMFVKERIPLPKFLKGQTGWRAFFKRLVWYALVLITIFLIKREKAFDQTQYRETIGNFVEQWIRSTLPILAVFIVKPTEDENNSSVTYDEEFVIKLHKLTSELRNASESDREDKIALLVSAFKTKGFECLEPATLEVTEAGLPIFKTMPWDDSLLEKYENITAAESGELVEIHKHPVIQNGMVLEKGKVARKNV